MLTFLSGIVFSIMCSLIVQAAGVLIRAHNIDDTTAFYEETLGFSVAARNDRWVAFDSNIPIFVAQSNSARYQRDHETAGISFVLHSIDLRETYTRWSQLGVRFESSEPNRNGIGRDLQLFDVEGNNLSLMQTDQPSGVGGEDGSSVYNFGFNFSNISEARQFFTQTLDFTVMTEQYFPPALPLMTSSGSFAFMLHEDSGLVPRHEHDDPYQAGLSVVFWASDLDALAPIITGSGRSVTWIDPERRNGVRAFSTVISEGVAVEFWEGGQPDD